jgi:hypothetical protein
MSARAVGNATAANPLGVCWRLLRVQSAMRCRQVQTAECGLDERASSAVLSRPNQHRRFSPQRPPRGPVHELPRIRTIESRPAIQRAPRKAPATAAVATKRVEPKDFKLIAQLIQPAPNLSQHRATSNTNPPRENVRAPNQCMCNQRSTQPAPRTPTKKISTHEIA